MTSANATATKLIGRLLTGDRLPIETTVLLQEHATKASGFEVFNNGGAGWSVRSKDRQAYLSAYGRGWTRSEDNAAVFDSKDQAQSAGRSAPEYDPDYDKSAKGDYDYMFIGQFIDAVLNIIGVASNAISSGILSRITRLHDQGKTPEEAADIIEPLVDRKSAVVMQKMGWLEWLGLATGILGNAVILAPAVIQTLREQWQQGRTPQEGVDVINQGKSVKGPKLRWDIYIDGRFFGTEWADTKQEAEDVARSMGNYPASVKVEAKNPVPESRAT